MEQPNKIADNVMAALVIRCNGFKAGESYEDSRLTTAEGYNNLNKISRNPTQN